MDIISAEGNASHRRALNVREGMLYKRYTAAPKGCCICWERSAHG